MWAFGIAILIGAIAELFFICTFTEPSFALRFIIAIFCALTAHIWHKRWSRSEGC